MEEFVQARLNEVHAEAGALPKAARHHDPITGDELSTGEWVSWQVQGVIRRWHFIGVITLVTVLIWLTDNATALLWWNLAASFLAILIESIVGLALFSQTKRDACVLREVRALAADIKIISQTVLKDVEQLEEEIEEVGH